MWLIGGTASGFQCSGERGNPEQVEFFNPTDPEVTQRAQICSHNLRADLGPYLPYKQPPHQPPCLVLRFLSPASNEVPLPTKSQVGPQTPRIGLSFFGARSRVESCPEVRGPLQLFHAMSELAELPASKVKEAGEGPEGVVVSNQKQLANASPGRSQKIWVARRFLVCTFSFLGGTVQ